MKEGDLVLFYHSNTKPPHVAGVARIVREGYPDFTSWDAEGKYFDENVSVINDADYDLLKKEIMLEA